MSAPGRVRLVRRGVTIGCAVAGVLACAAADWRPGAFSKHVVSVDGRALPYQAFVPRDYTPTRRWPLVLFIHGANELGTDGERQMRSCFAAMVNQQSATFPAIVLFPHVPRDEELPRQQLRDLITATIDSAERALAVDTDRVAIAGMSMGGGLAYEIAWQDAHRFSALMTVAAAIPPMSFTGDYGTPVGAVDSLVGAELRDLPTWVWHGEQDQLVTVTIPRAMIATFRRAGMRYLRYTEVPRGRHDCLSAFSDSASMRWLVTQRRGAPTP